VLGWEPQISLEEGMARTYAWIEEQVEDKLELRNIKIYGEPAGVAAA
jgi:dTDP-D-glucose 4,6-dehydratase